MANFAEPSQIGQLGGGAVVRRVRSRQPTGAGGWKIDESKLVSSLVATSTMPFACSRRGAPVDDRHSAPAFVIVVLVPATLMILVPALPLFLSMRWMEGRRRGEVPVDVY